MPGYEPDDFDRSGVIDELKRWREWRDDRDHSAGVARLQATDRQLRDRETERMVKALSPAGRRDRGQQLRKAMDMSDVTAKLEALAPDPDADHTRIIEEALTPSYFSAAWRALAAAEAAGEASSEMLAKASDQLHTLQYGVLMENVGLGSAPVPRIGTLVLSVSAD